MDLVKTVFAYEDMLEEKHISLDSYGCTDVHIPIDRLNHEKRTDAYLQSVYEKCLSEVKPWQALIPLDFTQDADNVY